MNSVILPSLPAACCYYNSPLNQASFHLPLHTYSNTGLQYMQRIVGKSMWTPAHELVEHPIPKPLASTQSYSLPLLFWTFGPSDSGICPCPFNQKSVCEVRCLCWTIRPGLQFHPRGFQMVEVRAGQHNWKYLIVFLSSTRPRTLKTTALADYSSSSKLHTLLWLFW